MKNQINKYLNIGIKIAYFVLVVLFFLEMFRPMVKTSHSERIANVVNGAAAFGSALIHLACASIGIILFIWYIVRIGEIKKMITISKELIIQINLLYTLLIIFIRV